MTNKRYILAVDQGTSSTKSLIFDEAGRLKYHVRNRIGTQARQNQRLEYLWETGAFNTKMSFSAMHLDSILRGQPTLEADLEDDDNGE